MGQRYDTDRNLFPAFDGLGAPQGEQSTVLSERLGRVGAARVVRRCCI